MQTFFFITECSKIHRNTIASQLNNHPFTTQDPAAYGLGATRTSSEWTNMAAAEAYKTN